MKNVDDDTVKSFGQEWSRLNQSQLSDEERGYIFGLYFKVFPWSRIPRDAEGFDMGCGSGRWATLVAPRVGHLNCIDASIEALNVARQNLREHENVSYFHSSADEMPLPEASQDFGYCLGVLHHIPNTFDALRACVSLLKPGAPLLIYVYYRFDNRPSWYKFAWSMLEWVRATVSRLPEGAKTPLTNTIALSIYFPLARLCLVGERLGFNMKNVPLYAYRNHSFYTMKTDSRDRFGTPLEKRFTKPEIKDMMERAGLVDITFSDSEPYWCAVGTRGGRGE